MGGILTLLTLLTPAFSLLSAPVVLTISNLLAVRAIPHPFPLNVYFGTLADGLDYFPLAYGRYHPYTDSR